MTTYETRLNTCHFCEQKSDTRPLGPDNAEVCLPCIERNSIAAAYAQVNHLKSLRHIFFPTSFSLEKGGYSIACSCGWQTPSNVIYATPLETRRKVWESHVKDAEKLLQDSKEELQKKLESQ